MPWGACISPAHVKQILGRKDIHIELDKNGYVPDLLHNLVEEILSKPV